MLMDMFNGAQRYSGYLYWEAGKTLGKLFFGEETLHVKFIYQVDFVYLFPIYYLERDTHN